MNKYISQIANIFRLSDEFFYGNTPPVLLASIVMTGMGMNDVRLNGNIFLITLMEIYFADGRIYFENILRPKFALNNSAIRWAKEFSGSIIQTRYICPSGGFFHDNTSTRQRIPADSSTTTSTQHVNTIDELFQGNTSTQSGGFFQGNTSTRQRNQADSFKERR